MKKVSIIFVVIITGFAMAKSNDIKVGDKAPNFTLIDQNNVEHTLSDYIGKKVVIYFYPKDDTPGCTKEACSIRDNYTLFEENEIMIFGLSFDSPASHKKFAEKHDLPFTLLSDNDKSVAKAYNSKGWFWAKRNTFLIDKNGFIFKIYKSVDVTTHTQIILNDFSKLNEEE